MFCSPNASFRSLTRSVCNPFCDSVPLVVCKTKTRKLTEYFEFHPHQPEITEFNATNLYFRPDDSGGRLQRLWLLYCEQKEALACNLCIAYDTTTSSNQNPRKFLTGFNLWKHIYQRIDEHKSSQKHMACVEAHIRFSSNKTVVDLLTVSQTLLHNKRVMQRRQIFYRVVSIVKRIKKRETSYRGTGSSEAVSTLCDEKVDHRTFLEIVLLAKYDNFLKCHLENVIKKCLQNNLDKHKHITVQTEIHLSPKLLLTLSLLLYLSKWKKKFQTRLEKQAFTRFNSRYNFNRQMFSYSTLCQGKRRRTTFCRCWQSFGNWSRPVKFVKRSFAEAKHRRFQMHLRQYRWSSKHVGAV